MMTVSSQCVNYTVAAVQSLESEYKQYSHSLLLWFSFLLLQVKLSTHVPTESVTAWISNKTIARLEVWKQTHIKNLLILPYTLRWHTRPASRPGKVCRLSQLEHALCRSCNLQPGSWESRASLHLDTDTQFSETWCSTNSICITDMCNWLSLFSWTYHILIKGEGRKGRRTGTRVCK